MKPRQWRSGPRRRAWFACAAVALGCLAAAPSAQAAFGISGTAAPSNPTSGANSDFNIDIEFGGNTAPESVKDLIVHLPPGLVGDPLATPLCTVAQLNADDCPDNTQVGTVSSNVSVIAGPVGQDVHGDLYNLVPQPGEPARFGIVLRPLDDILPKTIIQSAARLRPTDFGLDSVVNNIPNSAGGAPIHINSQSLTLFGEAPTGKAFLRNPTSCGTSTTGFDATSHGGESASAQSTFTLSGCENLPFSPSLTAIVGSPGQNGPAGKPGLTTVIEQDDGEAGLQRAQVILPELVSADAAVLATQCSTPQFQASSCPPETIVGEARAESPLQTVPLEGKVAIVEPLTPGGLPNLGVDLKGPLAIQLRGNFLLSPGPGNVFEGLPDIPIARFTLTFTPNKLVQTARDLCEPPTPTFQTDFLGHNGKTQVGPVEAQIAGCAPTAEVKLSKSRSKHPRMKAKVEGGGSTLRKVKVKLPRQLKVGKKKAFKRGAKAIGDEGSLGKSALKRGARSLKVNVEDGAQTLKVKARKKALRRVKKIKKGKSLGFPITVEDTGGFKTKLAPRAEAR
ncbi:MAG TPA: hypothetical protein VE523_08950 [Solirubrobacterales bacterium]|nr:hypothetical protein [Solirubrobacterales bacterium]